MTNAATTDETTAERLERRWFAALKAASGARSECEELLEVIDRAKSDWRAARLRLLKLEGLRDALGDAVAAIDAERDARACSDRAGAADAGECEVMSAA